MVSAVAALPRPCLQAAAAKIRQCLLLQLQLSEPAATPQATWGHHHCSQAAAQLVVIVAPAAAVAGGPCVAAAAHQYYQPKHVTPCVAHAWCSGTAWYSSCMHVGLLVSSYS
jgi:hypothetical protein